MMHSLRSVSSGGIVKGVGNQCCQVQHRQGIMARLLPARARAGVARTFAIVSLLSGCGGSAEQAADEPCNLGDGAGLIVVSAEHPDRSCFARRTPGEWCCLP